MRYNRNIFQLTMEKLMWKPVNYQSTLNSQQKPCPRWGHTCCNIGNQILLFGGYAQSVYMNDLWVFNALEMTWTEIIANGKGPSPRSNCSSCYDSANNRIYFFGGGGSNKTRFNTISVLDWKTKTWSEIKYQENQVVPEQRTYHTAELLYPYLVVHGGQGITDLDDLWLYNFETNIWKEIKTQKGQTKPCGRRFHSSCLIGNQFYVIAGCHTRYRCLNDIYSIDLSQMLKTGETENIKWKQRSTKGTALLSRWGHSSATYDGKIYIFGGRFSTDLNDLLVFDPQTETLKILKVSPDSLPKPRRRPSTSFSGSCLLMFGGFNSEYFNDLHYINLSQNFVKPKNYIVQLSSKQKLEYLHKITNSYYNSSQTSSFLYSIDNQKLPVFRELIETNFDDQQKIEDFLISIDRQLSYPDLVQILECLYLGYGDLKIFNKHNISIPKDEKEKIKAAQRSFEEKLLVEGSLSYMVKQKSNQGILELPDQKFGQMIQKNRQMLKSDVTFVINNKFLLESNQKLLSFNNKFFRAILNSYKQKTFKDDKALIKLTIPSNNMVLFQILLNSIIFGMLVVPEGMSHSSWMELYNLADYFCMPELKKVCVYQISLRMNDQSIQSIFEFSKNEEIKDLGYLCAKYKIKNIKIFNSKVLKDNYIKEVYYIYRFQILQKNMVEPVLKMGKQKSELTNGSEGEKQNFEIHN